ncbi:MAG: nitroreductase/dihydropteridine reductase [bacterium]|jgi:nitroreductase/dihydropteridine reductase
MSQLISQLNWRYAVKKFDSTKKLTEDQLDIVLESLRLSASSYGLQAWKFIVVNNPKLREELVQYSWGQEQVKDASHLIVMARPETITEEDVTKFVHSIAETRGVPKASLEGYEGMMNSKINSLSEEDKVSWLSKQIYIALGTLLTTAAFEGIDTCPMEGFEPENYDKVLGLKEYGLKTVVVCPVGFRSSEDVYADLKKVRYEKEDVVIELN